MQTEPVLVRLRGAFRSEVEAGPHRFVIDQPLDAGGSAEGPTPYDALAAALGSCTAQTIHFFARREKFPLEGVDVRVRHDRQHARDCADCLDKSGFIHDFHVEIALHGALTEEQRKALLKIATRCPVAKTLQSKIRILESLEEEGTSLGRGEESLT